ncbi:response regulator [Paenirhodobacter sp.]|uniref:response regulator n=1 Tax=Paenirhodobacter sp. TaxID=1965326 RepID=UPI003B3C10FF
MTEDLTRYLISRPVPSDRPLLGLTVLVVEDSRFASEALRLMALRSGARLRRADCLRAAYRHLQTYCPGVVVVDMGLPDGSGADLIRHIRNTLRSAPAIIGLSGDPALRETALEAGADGFLAKPLESLVLFQQAILMALPSEARPKVPRTLPDEVISPDPLALRDDLSEVVRMLAERPDPEAVGYVGQFLSGLARSTRDAALEDVASELRNALPGAAAISRAAGLVQARLAAGKSF